MSDEQLKEITERLNIIIKIMSVSLTEEIAAPQEQIKKLSTVGLSPSQIGRLLGKSTNTVTSYISRIKKSTK